jgi:hypothetical protein
MSPEEVDQLLEEIVDDILELHKKVREEPWTDVEFCVADLKRRVLMRMALAEEVTDEH